MEDSRAHISRSPSHSRTGWRTASHTHTLGLPDRDLESSDHLQDNHLLHQSEEYLGNTQPDKKPKLPWWKTPTPWWWASLHLIILKIPFFTGEVIDHYAIHNNSIVIDNYISYWNIYHSRLHLFKAWWRRKFPTAGHSWFSPFKRLYYSSCGHLWCLYDWQVSPNQRCGHHSNKKTTLCFRSCRASCCCKADNSCV